MTSPDAMRRLLEQATRELRRLRSEHAELLARAHEPIAVVGLACRFPGGADDPAAFWRLLADARDVVAEVPATRWPADPALASLRGARWAGLLDLPLADFDADFFGLSPREAVSLDPQQRLLLEVAWEALEDASIALDRLPARDVGVFVGLSNLDYGERVDAAPLDAYSATGNLHSTAAGRISHTLDLHGPCLAVDTACSSSLVAVHLAIDALQRRDCSLALAGGVHLLLSPRTMEKVARTQSLAPDGRCKTFDARADGFVRAEGCGVLALKRLGDAARDGDRIRAVLRGSAVGHDGHAAGLTAPNAVAQERLLRAALARAGLQPHDIGCIEAHGTGTSLGDPIEVEALRAVYGAPRPGDAPCFLASLKTNVGHMEAAAGVGGLIKLILALEHSEIPAHLHFKNLNPRIRLDGSALEIPTRARPWPRGPTPRRGAVSSFGISGTNAHVLVEEAPLINLSPGPSTPHLSPGPSASHMSPGPSASHLSPGPSATHLSPGPSASHLSPGPSATHLSPGPSASHLSPETATEHLPPGPSSPHLSPETAIIKNLHPGPAPAVVLPLSARSRGALRDLIAHHRDLLVTAPPAPADLAHAVAVGRTQEPWRRALVGRTPADLLAAADAAAADLPTTPARGRPRIVFVCPGQGSQWPGMAARLAAEEPVFRDALAACAAALQRHAGWDLRARLAAPLVGIDVVQPALFAYSVALAAVWRAWGVEPDVVIGHSMGEVAAAHLAGALDLDAAARVICTRSRLMRRLAGQGAMALVDLDEPAARAAIAGDPALAIAAVNGPRTTLLSGPEVPLERVLADLRARDVFARRVNVDVASHCAIVDPILPDLRAALADLSPRTAAIAMHSTVTARPLAGPELDAAYWARNLRDVVRFADVVRDLATDTLFIELGPHPVLVPAIAAAGARAVASVLRDSDEPLALRAALAAVFEAGHPISWAHPDPARPRLALPHYPWQRQPHWISPPPAVAAPRGLPGLRRSSADDPDLHTWDTTLAAHDPAVADHRVDGRVVVPAAAFVVMLTRALAELGAAWQLHDLRLERLLELGDAPTHVQLTLRLNGTRGAAAIHARTADHEPWLRHVDARLERTPADPELRHVDAPTPDTHHTPTIDTHHAPTLDTQPTTLDTHADLATLRARCPQPLAPDEHAARLAALGLDFGPRFRCIDELHAGPGECLLRARLPDGDGDARPALLDACLQALYVAAGSPARRLLPVRIAAISRLAELPAAAWCHAVVRAHDPLRGDLTIFTDRGPIAHIHGLEVRPADAAPNDIFYDVAWIPAPDAHDTPPSPATPTAHADARDTPPSPVAPRDTPTAHTDAHDKSPSSASPRDTPTAHHSPVAPRSAADTPVAAPHLRIVGDELRAIDLAARLTALGAVATRHSLADAAAYAHAAPPAALVVLLPDAPPADPAHAALANLTALATLVRALVRRGDRDPPRLVLVTRGAQPAGDAPGDRLDHAPAWGLGRSLAHEHPELRCTLVDLDPAGPDDAETAALARALLAPDAEDQLALRRPPPVPRDSPSSAAPSDTPSAARASAPVPADIHAASAPVPADIHAAPPPSDSASAPVPVDIHAAPAPSDAPRLRRLAARLRLADLALTLAPAGARPFALLQERPGVLDGLTLRAVPRRPPGPGEVELAVEAAGLNFLDVLLAHGLLRDVTADPDLGGECVGRVTAVGPGVIDLRPGDRVLALAPRSFATHTLARADLCLPVPSNLSVHAAATLPIAGLTAVHALDHVARVRPGERVLIHAAAGGVGLYALQLALARGAEVFATAGTEAKRRLLRERGAHHVASSRDLSFVEHVRRHTRGDGVDIILNSLAGELLTASLELLRPGGRFIELGKRDYADDRRVGLRPFLRRISWTLVDLRGLVRDDPARARAGLEELLALVAAGTLAPIPHQIIKIADARDAFAAMARGDHTGKFVLDLGDAAATPVAPPRPRPTVRDDGVVLITGGTGGVGLALARMLVDRGVRRLALLARTAPDPATLAAIDALRRGPGDVDAATADTTSTTAAHTVDAPIATATPTVDAPIATAAHTVDAPIATAAPVADAPLATAAPVADAPIATAAPTADAPIATAAPVADAPIATAAPTVDAPIATAAPVADAPTLASPVQIQLLRADVADETSLAAALAAIDGPLVGAIHAAGVLDDGALLNLDPERVARVAAPKIAGAWHLHRLTAHLPLEFFVLCGSASAVLGSPGQAAYAGANAWLGALAAHRRARGRPALCVDWGAWDDVGLAAARADRGRRLAGQGLSGMSPGTAAAALADLLAHGVERRAVMRLHVRRWRESHLAAARAPLLDDLAAPASAAPASARARLAALPLPERRLAVQAHLQAQLARVLRRPASGLGLDDPLQQTGLDSLMAMELRNRLEVDLGLALAVTLIWRHPSIRALADHLAAQLGPAEPARQDMSPAQPVPADTLAPPVLSDTHLRPALSDARPQPVPADTLAPPVLSDTHAAPVPADSPEPSPAIAALLAAVARLAREDP